MNAVELLLVALLIYIPNQIHFPADLGLKGVNVLNVLLILTIGIMLATGARARSTAPLSWPIGAFGLTLVVSFLVGQTHPAAEFSVDVMTFKSVITPLLVYFIFFHGARDPERLGRLVNVILFVAFVAAVEAIREGLDYGLAAYSTSHRASGPFGTDFRTANRAGVFYAMFLPMFLAQMLFRRRNRRMALAGLVGAVFLLFAIFVTYSRQAYLIAAVGVVLLGLRRHAVVGIVVVALVSTFTLWAPDAAVERMQMTYVQSDSGNEEMEVSAKSRFVIWAAAGAMIASHPLGVGLSRFQNELGRYGEGEVQHKDAHNSFVLLTAEGGLQCLAALVIVLAGLGSLAVKQIRAARDDEARALAYGYGVTLVCMVMGNLYGSAFLSSEVMSNFWALSGLVAVNVTWARRPRAQPEIGVAPVQQKPVSRWHSARRA